ncbi:MAG: hypothetical protein L6R39_006581 [Caloplaca ligustica]|nr:MAG: hypothetical protein L6R39_006581 [Caloplaca ligustica]
MSTIVLLPISDYEERLLGRRLVTATPTFETGGVKIFHNAPNPSILASSSPTNTTPPTTPSALQTLPTEIPFLILSMVFEDVKPDDWLSAQHHAGATPASVIFTCSQLYREGRQLALEACTFEYGDLPENYRIVGWEGGVVCDYREDR